MNACLSLIGSEDTDYIGGTRLVVEPDQRNVILGRLRQKSALDAVHQIGIQVLVNNMSFGGINRRLPMLGAYDNQDRV